MEKEMDILAIIAGRKAEFIARAERAFLARLTSESNISEQRSRFQKAVSLLDNSLFVSAGERATGIINPGASVATLRLDSRKIMEELSAAMARMRQET